MGGVWGKVCGSKGDIRGAGTMMLMLCVSSKVGIGVVMRDVGLDDSRAPLRRKCKKSTACRRVTMCSSLDIGERRWTVRKEVLNVWETSGRFVRIARRDCTERVEDQSEERMSTSISIGT
jgi:hypothetical protein